MKTGQDRETRITKFSYTKCYKCWTPVDRLRSAQTNLTLFKCIREELYERSIYIYKYISRIFFSLLLENNFEG